MTQGRPSGTRSDRRLGLDRSITRRDFLNATLWGTGLGWLEPGVLSRLARLEAEAQGDDWYGYGGVGDYAASHGNTPEAVRIAHEMRDGRYAGAAGRATATGERFDLGVVGSGMAGYGAALQFTKHRREGQTCLMLDNHPVFGGESKRNEFLVNGVRLIGPQGANGFSVPPPDESTVAAYARGDATYYAELEVPREFSYQAWDSRFKPLRFGRDNYGFMLWLEEQIDVGYFFDRPGEAGLRCVVNPWRERLAGTGFSGEARESLLRWQASNARPRVDQDIEHWLDSMTYKEYIESVMGLSPEVTRYADPIVAGATGLGCDVISAYAAYSDILPGVRALVQPAARFMTTRESFPGGNDGFSRYFVKALIPGAIRGSASFEDILNRPIDFRALDRRGQPVRMRLGATVVGVEHDGPAGSAAHVWVTYVNGGELRRVRARGVVMATGAWVNRHVVADLPAEHREACAQFHHAPFLVVNVALTNWRFLYRLGVTACRWFGGFGFSCNIRQPMVVGDYRPPLDPDRPTLLTFYVPFYYPGLPIREQGVKGRTELLSTSFGQYERQIREQMVQLFGSAGFDPRRDIAGIVLNRWGHAYVNPQPGFYFGRDGRPAPRDVIRRRFGRIAFGHSELRGNQHWGPAADEGRRAAEQVLGAI